MNEPDNFSLVRRLPSSVEKAELGAKRILLRMASETMAVARKGDALRREEAESWFQKGKQLRQKAGELFDTIREVVARLHKAADSVEGQESIKCFQKAAELGHAAAQEQLGMLFHNGEGVTKNYHTAFHWYCKAADQGHAGAQRFVADCYRAGLGVERDHAKAVGWYRKAGDSGCTQAYSILASLYEQGDGVPQDDGEALRWLTKSAESGGWSDAYRLGLRYRVGKKIPRDYTQAAKWFRIAAERGHSQAAYFLGQQYLAGRGVEQNKAEAINWFQRAAAKNDAPAQCQLGHLYLEGNGVTRDAAEAAMWFHAAADAGDPEASEMMGLCYERGWGLPRDFVEAFVWYSLAADGSKVSAGRVSAKREANRLQQKMTADELKDAKARYEDNKAFDQLVESTQIDQIGKCPLCAGWIVLPSSFYVCRKRGCKFRVHRLADHHRITIAEMQRLLIDGRTDLLTGFISKSGARFSARLVMDRKSGQVTIENEPA